MKSKRSILFPRYTKIMEVVGENIKLARRRRKLTVTEIAARAGISRVTLSKIEKGVPSVAIGSYFNVLKTLGLGDDFLKLAGDEVLKNKLAHFSKKEPTRPFISKRNVLAHLGMNIKLARKRRGLTMVQVADGAHINRETLYRVEKGEGSVSIGIYFKILRVLHLHKDILLLAQKDELGLKLRDLELLH